ncbi:MAG: carbohydrate kinase family protein [Candidatus Heimdallarchaeota archaeon]
MENNFDLISIGSCTLDCIISVKDILRFELFENESVKKYTAIEYSRKLNIDNVTFVPGGSGANIASNCAMLGLKSTYIGVIGNDFSAKICLDDLKERGVDTSNIKQTDEDNTAFSVILKTEWGKDRSILAFKGANNLLSPKEVKEELFKGIKAFAWTSLTSENGCQAIEKAINFTKESGGIVFGAPSMSIIKNNPKWAKKLINKSDVISMNAEEAKEFTAESDNYYSIRKIYELGPKLVSITDGANGSLLTDGKKLIKSSIYNVDVKDTTGAGDAFLSGVLVSKLNQFPLDHTIKLATALSSLECMEVGVREGIPNNIQEVEEFASSHQLTQIISEFSKF